MVEGIILIVIIIVVICILLNTLFGISILELLGDLCEVIGDIDWDFSD